ncbi:hypothetical protein [Streptosporangium sandarakinum]|uniref:Uncharacterized protein n=1 Tax=Streptosporangium sandarakinum TaxID=1260955 RepID=A0A852UQN1_9ACTN|nr:hypothetical protein [Streptosporangium sandarakinum]NYF39402.1 hypothetical protein [Streptosporangium sandarakinum]
MLRSMLTHPEAADAVRAALGGQVDRVGAELPSDDARLRDAPREEIDRLLRPALRALLDERE